MNVFIFCLLQYIAISYSLNIALHAQLHPNSGKIVGSVITTDGLKAAFQLRNEIYIVDIFYPNHYDKFYDVSWDVIIIEGWFPSINHFIWISRTYNSKVKILFYCLDPTYPSLDITTNLDVDGYLTNSKYLSEHVLNKVKPTLFVLLGADPNQMKPLSNQRIYKSIYIGAGGSMIETKQFLYYLLRNASTLGDMAIYGSNWNNYIEFLTYYRGILSREEISYAYSLSHVVLASTIDSQRQFGMINNRIFEALSCGSIVITEYYQELFELFGDNILYSSSNQNITDIIIHVINNSEIMNLKRSHSRQLIINQHSWSHRIIEILHFYNDIRLLENPNKNHLPNSFPKSSASVAVIVSSRLADLSDYIIFQYHLLQYFDEYKYNQYIYSEVEFLDKYKKSCSVDLDSFNNDCSFDWFAVYDAVIVISFPFDILDNLFVDQLPRILYTNNNKFYIQRRILFIFGVDEEMLPVAVNSNRYSKSYDVLYYRNYYDISVLNSKEFTVNDYRIQDMIGFNLDISTNQTDVNSTVSELVVCFIEYFWLCNQKSIANYVHNSSSTSVIMIGGNYSVWFKYSDLFLSSCNISLSNISIMSRKTAYDNISIYIIKSNKVYLFIDYSKHQQKSYDNSIWLFVMVIGLNKQIFIYSNNKYIESLTQHSNIQSLDHNHLYNSIKTGFIRAFSFSLSLTSVDFTSFELSNNTISLSNNCLDSINKANIYLFSIQYHYFRPGYDGECCILMNGRIIQCMIWLFPFIGIVVRSPHSSNELNLSIRLRGNMIDDFYYQKNLTLFNISNHHHIDNSGYTIDCDDLEIFLLYI